MIGKIQAIAGGGADQFLDLFVSGQSQTLPEVLPSEQYLRGRLSHYAGRACFQTVPEFVYVALTAIMPSLHLTYSHRQAYGNLAMVTTAASPKDVLHRLWPARPVRPRLMAQASFACSIRFMIRFASARMFTAAFTSLLCSAPHSGHVHSRTLRSLVLGHTCWQTEQVWDDG